MNGYDQDETLKFEFLRQQLDRIFRLSVVTALVLVAMNIIIILKVY